MKVLIIQQKMIGDVLTSTILFEVLRKEFPKAQLHYLVNTNTIPVLENSPYIDKIVEFTPEIDNSKKAFKTFRDNIKEENYTLVIDVYSKLSSAWIASSSKAEYRLSYYKWYTKRAYTHTYKDKKRSNTDAGLAIENRLLLLQNILPLDGLTPKPKIFLTASEILQAEQLLAQHNIDRTKKVFMIGVLGSDAVKTYPLPYLAKLLDFIVAQEDCTLLYNYIPSQLETVKELFSLCNAQTQKATNTDLYGKSLREFLALTHHCDALIGNEGGAVNMAKALDVPTFSIFSPWILKGAWNSFEADGKNVSVHLSDFHPEIYAKHPKKYKKQSEELYQKLQPELIIPILKDFLSKN